MRAFKRDIRFMGKYVIFIPKIIDFRPEKNRFALQIIFLYIILKVKLGHSCVYRAHGYNFTLVLCQL